MEDTGKVNLGRYVVKKSRLTVPMANRLEKIRGAIEKEGSKWGRRCAVMVPIYAEGRNVPVLGYQKKTTLGLIGPYYDSIEGFYYQGHFAGDSFVISDELKPFDIILSDGEKIKKIAGEIEGVRVRWPLHYAVNGVTLNIDSVRIGDKVEEIKESLSREFPYYLPTELAIALNI